MVDGENNPLAAGAAWMKGEIVPIAKAGISVLDWGLTRSDITYDVVHVWDGAFFRLDDYLERFERSRKELRLDVGLTTAEIREILHELVATSGLRSAYVSMVASRGVPSVPGSRDPRLCTNHFFAWVVPFIWVIRPEVAKRGAHIKISETSERISVRSVDPTVKNYHWGDMTKALFEALDEGYDTTILLDENGYVTEGPGFNIFMISGNRLLTPKSGMLEGISRRTVMEIGAELGMEVAATDITAEEFLAADEVFTATTGGGPVPVTRVNSTILGNDAIGEKTQGILDAYWDWHERPALSTPIVYPA